MGECRAHGSRRSVSEQGLRRLGDEAGQALVLVLAVLLVCLAVAGVTVDMMRATLLRRSLQSIADSAVTTGASQLDKAQYYSSGGVRAGLDRDAAGMAARRLLERRTHVDSMQVTAAGSAVRAFVSGRVRTSFLRVIGVRHLRVTARATAEPVFGEG